MYHVPLAVQCIYGWNDKGGEDTDGTEGSEITEGWERIEITWPFMKMTCFYIVIQRRT